MEQKTPLNRYSKRVKQQLSKKFHDKELIAFDLYWTCIQHPKLILNDTGKTIIKDLRTILQEQPIELNEIKAAYHSLYSDSELEEFQQQVKNNIQESSTYPDFLWTIKYLKSKWYTTAVISNLSKDYEEPLTTLIPEGSFDYNILSFNVWAMKPHPQIFEELKRQSWIDYEKMVMIGDSMQSDVEWSKNVWIEPIYLDRKSKSPIKYINKKHLIQISTLDALKDIF